MFLWLCRGSAAAKFPHAQPAVSKWRAGLGFSDKCRFWLARRESNVWQKQFVILSEAKNPI
jgi:hypothetical protein